MGASLGEDEIGRGQGTDQLKREDGPQEGWTMLRGPALEEFWGAWPCVTLLPTPCLLSLQELGRFQGRNLLAGGQLGM